jgi:hypothetical protein
MGMIEVKIVADSSAALGELIADLYAQTNAGRAAARVIEATQYEEGERETVTVAEAAKSVVEKVNRAQAKASAGGNAPTTGNAKPAITPDGEKSEDSTAGTDTSGTTTSTSSTATTAASPSKPAANDEQPAIAYADVQKRVSQVALKKGRDDAVALLGEFEVDHGSKLTEDQWAAFCARADEVLAA